MGKALKSPPVYFTVAQLRFNPILQLGEYLPAIQEAFRRARYSDFLEHPTQVIKITQNDGKTEPEVDVKLRFSFGNAERTHSFLLDESSLTLQSTDYGTFEGFSETFLAGLVLLDEIVKLEFVERVGVRYLDYVTPLAVDYLGSYLHREALGLTLRLAGDTQYSYCETRLTEGDVTLLSRAVTRVGGLSFPADLTPFGLEPLDRFKLQPEKLHATLDNDAFIERRESYAADTVRKRLETLHAVVSKAFHSLVTPYAKDVWEREL